MLRVLARLDDPRQVAQYIHELVRVSSQWPEFHKPATIEKAPNGRSFTNRPRLRSDFMCWSFRPFVVAAYFAMIVERDNLAWKK